MEWVSLQKISIGLLMLFNYHTSATIGVSATNASPAGCISKEKADRQVSRFESYWKGQLNVYGETEPRNCDLQAGKLLACRSLSPWNFSIEKVDGRIPHAISRAQCLYNGCIINQQENFSYNSVPVYAKLNVLRKSRCGSDPRRYIITTGVVRVPVACTCAVPKYAK